MDNMTEFVSKLTRLKTGIFAIYSVHEFEFIQKLSGFLPNFEAFMYTLHARNRMPSGPSTATAIALHARQSCHDHVWHGLIRCQRR